MNKRPVVSTSTGRGPKTTGPTGQPSARQCEEDMEEKRAARTGGMARQEKEARERRYTDRNSGQQQEGADPGPPET